MQTPRATYQDVIDAPAHRNRGDRRRYPAHSPAACHARMHSRARRCRAISRTPSSSAGVVRVGGGSSSSPSCTSAKTSWFPTWRAGAASGMPDYPDTAYVTLPPDWVCEVFSALTRRLDLQEKPPGLRPAKGSAHLWLGDPADRTLEAFRAPATANGCSSGSAKDGEPVSIPPLRRDHVQPRRSLALSARRRGGADSPAVG